MAEIKIVKKLKDTNDPGKGHKLEPEKGRRTPPVKVGELVTFTLAEGAEGLTLTIAFTQASPFGPGQENVKYNQPTKVTVSVNPAGTEKNVFPYSCVTSDGASSDNGGEMEVIHN